MFAVETIINGIDIFFNIFIAGVAEKYKFLIITFLINFYALKNILKQ